MAEQRKQTQGEIDRAKELARRAAREQAAKAQPSVIVHSPVQK